MEVPAQAATDRSVEAQPRNACGNACTQCMDAVHMKDPWALKDLPPNGAFGSFHAVSGKFLNEWPAQSKPCTSSLAFPLLWGAG